MATIVKTPSATWKAVIRKSGWPTTVKTFRTKRDAEDWSRRTEDEMVRGAYIQRATADRMTIQVALERYLKEVVPTKRSSSQIADVKRSRILIEHLGKYSLAALTPEIVAKFRDMRLAGEDRRDQRGKPQPRTNNTVRLDLALLAISIRSRSKSGVSALVPILFRISADLLPGQAATDAYPRMKRRSCWLLSRRIRTQCSHGSFELRLRPACVCRRSWGCERAR